MLRMPDVVRLAGVSESTIKRRVQDGSFPKPMHLSPRCIGWPAREVNPVRAFGVAQTRCSCSILGAVEHGEFAMMQENCRIERASRFPTRALRRKDGLVGGASPCAEGETGGLPCPHSKRNSAGEQHQRNAQTPHRIFSFFHSGSLTPNYCRTSP